MSGALDLAKELGLSNEELTERVVSKCVERVMESVGYDEDGEADTVPSSFAKKLQKAVIARVDKAIDAIASKHILPNVTTYLETLCLQETNQWGEKKGKSITFLEYLVDRAQKYMTEQVNNDGKSESEMTYDRHNFRGKETRIANLVHNHLSFYIQRAMEETVKNGNAILIEGIQETVKAKLAEVAEKLKVGVITR